MAGLGFKNRSEPHRKDIAAKCGEGPGKLGGWSYFCGSFFLVL